MSYLFQYTSVEDAAISCKLNGYVALSILDFNEI